MPWDIKNDYRTRTQHFESLLEQAEKAERLFRDYFQINGAEFRKTNINYRSEISVKLRQLSLIFSRLIDTSRLMDAETRRDRMPSNLSLDSMKFYSEAFYWFAWRARQAMEFVPGLHKFDCPLVRNIRNRLLEHPEKGSGIITGNFNTGFEGPIVKPASMDKLHEWDRGLFPNAVEYFDNLDAMLERAINNVKGLSDSQNK